MSVLKYADYDAEAAQAELDESEAAGGGAAFMKLKPGKNIIRILPPQPGARSPFRVTHQHFLNLPGGKSKSVICARLEAKQPCKVCEKIDELRQSQAKVDQDMASDLFARRRVFVNVIDRNDEEAGPKVLAFGKTVHEQLLALRTDTKGGGNFAHPEDGFDIVIERKGSGKNDTEYTVRGDRNNSQLGPSVEVMQEWIDTQHNLNSFIRLPSPDDVAAALSGEEVDNGRGARAAAPTNRLPPRAAAESSRTTSRQPAPARQAPATRQRARYAEDDAIDVEGEEVAE